MIKGHEIDDLFELWKQRGALENCQSSYKEILVSSNDGITKSFQEVCISSHPRIFSMQNSIILPKAPTTDGLKGDFFYFSEEVHFVGNQGAVQSDLSNNPSATHSYTQHFLSLVLNKTSLD